MSEEDGGEEQDILAGRRPRTGTVPSSSVPIPTEGSRKQPQTRPAAEVPTGPTTTRPGAAAPSASLIIADRFVVRGELGRGSAGVVYSAFDRVRGEDVALKMLREGTGEGLAAGEFLERMTGVQAFRHPNVVEVLEIGTFEGRAWVASELLFGEDVTTLLGKLEAPPPVATVVSIAAQVAAALGFAHARGLVHRDVKGRHVFVADDGNVRLLDLGMPATVLSSHSPRSDSLLVGDPNYLAPERIRGLSDGDEAGDLYALGVLLYELFTLRKPFEGSTKGELFRRVTSPTERPDALRKHNPDVPPQLEDLTLKLLRKEPDQRPSDSRAIAGTLRRFDMVFQD
jgi:serine/threonine protein kinase